MLFRSPKGPQQASSALCAEVGAVQKYTIQPYGRAAWVSTGRGGGMAPVVARGRLLAVAATATAPVPATWGGGVGTRFLRTGCTVLWQLSQNLVGSEFTIPRPFPFAVHGGTVAAPVAGNKYRQVAEKGELSVRTRYSCSTSTPVLDLIHAPRQGCPNASVQKSQKHLVERTGELARAC